MAPVIPSIFFFILLGILFADIIELSFAKLGIPGWATLLIFAGSLIGSTINIPLWTRNEGITPGYIFRHHGWIGYHPPVYQQQVIAINVGGAIIPILLSLYLLEHTHLLRTLLAIAIVAVVSHIDARIVPGQGVEMDVWIAPVTAALCALVLTLGDRAAPMAYIAGTIGALLGADISNLGRLSALGPGWLSIGGAGVFDGVFLSGFVAALISFERPRRPRFSRPPSPRHEL